MPLYDLSKLVDRNLIGWRVAYAITNSTLNGEMVKVFSQDYRKQEYPL
jgi:hypothetical protein